MNKHDDYLRLADGVVFKNRYHSWFLIHNQTPEKAVLAKDGAELVISFLLKGNSISRAAKKFNLGYETLVEFLRSLNDIAGLAVIEFSTQPISRQRIGSINPPLDSLSCLITNGCNLNCRHCYLRSGRPMPEEMAVSQWIDVINQFVGLGGFLLNITGGEPMMHPGFWRLIKSLAKIKPALNINLNTNGTLLKAGQIPALKSAFDTVQVSIDDPNQEAHDFFRGQSGAFQGTITATRLMVEAGIKVNVAFCLTPDNIVRVDKIIKLCQDLGIYRLTISLPENIGRGANNQVLPEMDAGDQFFGQVFDLTMSMSKANTGKLQVVMPLHLPGEKQPEKRFICSGDRKQIAYIMADGGVLPCDKLPVQEFGCGNIKNNSLRDIWLSRKMVDFKCRSPRSFPKCGSCHIVALCGGPCVARAYANSGSIEGQDHLSCYFARRTHDVCAIK